MNNTFEVGKHQTPATARRRWPLNGMLVGALLVLLSACNDDDTASVPPTEASATIGAAGGTLDGPDGVQLVVPPGALTQDTAIRIARTDAGAPGLPSDYTVSTPVYEFTPHGLSFLAPVTIRMPYAAPAGAVHDDVFVAAPGEDWQAMQATVNGGMAEWSRLSLSYYAGLWCGIPAGNTDPYRCVWPRLGAGLTATPQEALVRNAGGNAIATWTLNAAASLRFNLVYAAARDCEDARVRILRKNNGTGDVIKLLDQPVAMIPQTDKKAGGSISFDVALGYADNGYAWFGLSFACTRPGRTRTTDGLAHGITVNIAQPPAAPSITQQPVDASVNAGETAVFTVAATAPNTLSIGWQQSSDAGQTWSDQGSSGASLSLPAVAAADNGKRFRARVCNTLGTAQNCIDSSAALLTVSGGLALVNPWDAPQVIAATGRNDNGAAAGLDGARRAHAVWMAQPAGAAVPGIHASLGTVQGSWAAPVRIDGALSNSYEPVLAVASGGAAAAVWGYAAGGQYHLAANYFDGNAWGAAQRLDTGNAGNSSEGRVAIDASGRAVAVWQQPVNSIYVVFASVNVGGGWTSPVRVDRGTGGDVPQVAVDASGRGFITFQTSSALMATPVDLGAGSVFGTPVLVATEDFFGDARLAVDQGGGAIVAWFGYGDTRGYNIRHSRYTAAGGWTAAANVATDVNFSRDMALASDGSGHAIVAWVGTNAGSGDDTLYSRRYTPADGWSAVKSHATPVQNVQAVTNAAGRMVLSWIQLGASGSNDYVWAQVFDGVWREAKALQASANGAFLEGPPLVGHGLAINAEGSVLMLWNEDLPTPRTDVPLLGAYLP